jgi:hypothetical protein
MGETCSTCQNKNISFDEIKVEEEVKKDDLPKKSNASIARNTQNPINNREVEETRK